MPVMTEIRIPLTVEEITSSWGPRHSRPASPRVTTLLSELLLQLEANHWMEPKISFDICRVSSAGPGWIELNGESRLSSPALSHQLPGATQIAAGVCTIGTALEQQVRQWFANSERLRAVMLDEIGTLALFHLANELENRLQLEAGQRGLDAGGVLSPGEGGFQISQQAAVLRLARGAEIGVSQTTAGMLAPRKSISMIIGFGKRMPKWTRGERCARCGARERCPHWRSQLVEVAT
jgi:hypothetical protein